MYRAMALYFLRKGIDASDEAAIAEAAGEVEVTIAYEDGVQPVSYTHLDVYKRQELGDNTEE